MSIKSEEWEVTRLSGACPRLTSLNINLQDSRSGKLFTYGGLDPGEEDEMPQSYFHVCDIATMTFTDLTNSLVYLPPGDPFSAHNRERRCIPLPPLSCPGATFFRINRHPMIFLFGGHDATDGVDAPSSKLVAIHTCLKVWYFVEFEANQPGQRSPVARIDPVLVACGHHLYIFGGFREFGNSWKHHFSYSIIEFVDNSHKCRWVAMDVSYPNSVPRNHVFSDAVAIANSRILLFPGRRECNDHIDFKHDNIFYFSPDNKTFSLADIRGELPKNIHWSYVREFEPIGPLKSTSPPSVFVCTWTLYTREHLSPEVWRFNIRPRDEIEVVCLNLHKRVYDLDVNFRRFYLVENSMYLMGQGGNGDEPDDGSDTNSTISTGTDAGAMCDTYVRIPV